MDHSGAAERSPDKCSQDLEAARALNVDAARTLANLTQERSIFLIYISTDYVFPGKPGEAPIPPMPLRNHRTSMARRSSMEREQSLKLQNRQDSDFLYVFLFFMAR